MKMAPLLLRVESLTHAIKKKKGPQVGYIKVADKFKEET
jgi:hypothetical protein